MPDRDERGSAWKVPPSRYLAGRPAEHRVGAPTSVYVAMADGCRLAVDVILPDGDASKRWPTVLILTPYVRRFDVTAGSNVEPSPNTWKYRDMFVPRGYALVVVDARGTGASFGTRDAFRSPRERADYRAIADWIVAQTWSDGRIGATGISYLGAACDFLASTGHPAVKAIAPLFAVWDTWADNYYPGGLLIKKLALVYDELMLALDHDRRDLRAKFSYFADPALQGPLPVDDDKDGALAREAVKGHLGELPHARLHHRVQIPRRRAALRSHLHQRLVQPLQLSRRDAEGRGGLRHLRLDGRRGLRQRRAVALPDAAQRRPPPHAGAVGPWRAGQRLAVARAGRARAAGAGRGAALLRRASGRPQTRASARRIRSTISPCTPRNGARPRAGRR